MSDSPRGERAPPRRPRPEGIRPTPRKRRGPPPAVAAPEPEAPRAPPPAGLPARGVAAGALHGVLRQRFALDEALAHAGAGALPPADAGLARAIAAASLRRLGLLRRALAERLEHGLPRDAGRLEPILLTAAAQLLLMDVPDHAAVDLGVTLVGADHRSGRYAKLANGLLRRLAREREAVLAGADPLEDAPDWLRPRWLAAYGEDGARAIAAANGREAALDVTAREDAAGWAARLGAHLLPTGSLRLAARTPVAELPGYAEGAWWVQDASAAIPARLLAPRAGMRVLDLCAAPGGKAAQLAAAGARVTAVDRSAPRAARLRENLARLRLEAQVVVGDGLALEAALLGGPFDAVLVDAPCTATGTARRHPEVPWTRGMGDLNRLVPLQERLLAKAAMLVRPGGRVVFATCSLEPEEGEERARAFLAAHPGFRRVPVEAGEVGGVAGLINADGDLRALPDALDAALPEGVAPGVDGFFAARFERV